MFFDPSNIKRVPVEGGSGRFSVRSLDPQIVKAEYEYASRQVVLTPRNPGRTQIEVVDTVLLNHGALLINYRAEVPKEVRIQVASKSMQVGESNAVRVTVTDFEDQPFPLEEFKFMKVQLVDESPELERNFRVESTGEPDLFSFKPRAKGLYNLGAKVTSDFQAIVSEDYEPVEAFLPLSLSLAEGQVYLGESCASTVRVLGGPDVSTEVEVRHSAAGDGHIELREIGERHYEMVGGRPGQVTLTVQAKRQARVISSVSTLVRVVKIGQVKISGSISPERKLHQGAQVRMLPELYYEGQLLTHARCPFEYRWKVSSEDILQAS